MELYAERSVIGQVIVTQFLSEKIDESLEVLEVIEASKRLYGLSKFTFYATVDGLVEIFSKLYNGVSSFFERPPRSNQLCFWPLT